MRWRTTVLRTAAAALSTALLLAPVAPARDARRPGGFAEIARGSGGGTVVAAAIPGPAGRPSLVYLPPGFGRGRRYPVLYLLHGIPGSPYSYVDGLRLAAVADGLIAEGAARPFIAIMPPAGTSGQFRGEWTGIWEREVVADVVPWADAHLPTIAARNGRAIAGLSAGGYGAVDIGLRHPSTFGTLEAWSGYFHPLRDGSLRNAGRSELAAHDPTDLVEREAPLLRRLGTRFFLSCGSTHDRPTAAFARAFAGVLRALRLQHELVLRPGGHDGRFWRAQLPAAIEYAFRPSPRAVAARRRGGCRRAGSTPARGACPAARAR